MIGHCCHLPGRYFDLARLPQQRGKNVIADDASYVNHATISGADSAPRMNCCVKVFPCVGARIGKGTVISYGGFAVFPYAGEPVFSVGVIDVYGGVRAISEQRACNGVYVPNFRLRHRPEAANEWRSVGDQKRRSDNGEAGFASRRHWARAGSRRGTSAAIQMRLVV